MSNRRRPRRIEPGPETREPLGPCDVCGSATAYVEYASDLDGELVTANVCDWCARRVLGFR